MRLYLEGKFMAKLKPMYDKEGDVPLEFKGAFTESEGKYIFSGGEIEFYSETDKQGFETAKGHIKTELASSKEAFRQSELKVNEAVSKNEILELQLKDGADPAKMQELVDTKVKAGLVILAEENEALKGINSDFQNKIYSGDKNVVVDGMSKLFSDNVTKESSFILGHVMERQADDTYLTNGGFGIDAGLNQEQAAAKLIELNPTWVKPNTPANQGGGSGGNASSGMARFNELKTKVDAGGASRKETNEYIQVAETVANEAKNGE